MEVEGTGTVVEVEPKEGKRTLTQVSSLSEVKVHTKGSQKITKLWYICMYVMCNEVLAVPFSTRLPDSHTQRGGGVWYRDGGGG